MTAQISLFGARLRPTRPLLAHRRAEGVLRRVRRCLTRFPELDEATIIIGVTRAADGIAVIEDRILRFDVRRRIPTHYTIAHELTHLLQGMRLVPHGEVQCDIWTLARDPLFLDEPPCYLPVPRTLRKRWGDSAPAVGRLCAESVRHREHHRTYIRWLRGRLAELAEDFPAGQGLSAPS